MGWLWQTEIVVLMWIQRFACDSSCTGPCMNFSPVFVVRHDESAKSGRMQRQHSLPFWCSPSRSDARRSLRIRQNARFERLPAQEIQNG